MRRAAWAFLIGALSGLFVCNWLPFFVDLLEIGLKRSSLVQLGERHLMTAAGFSYRPMTGYGLFETDRNVLMHSPDGNTAIGLWGLLIYEDMYFGIPSDEEMMDYLLMDFEEMKWGEFERGESYSVSVDLKQGNAFEFSGKSEDEPVEGVVYLIRPSDNQVFIGFFMVKTNANQNSKNRGEEAFNTVIRQVRILEINHVDSSSCPVSIDESYGYSSENPIKVGGGSIIGPRNRVYYLDSLIGRNGEKIHYSKLGPEMKGENLLDKYEVWHDGMEGTVTLYLDKTNHAELMAPVGFVCWRTIPSDIPETEELQSGLLHLVRQAVFYQTLTNPLGSINRQTIY